MLDYKGIQKLLKDSEGFKSEVYDDGAGNPTLGYGFNLRDKNSLEAVKRNNFGNTETISENNAGLALNDLITQKRKAFESERLKKAPSYIPSPNEEEALTSLMYHSPKLIGPNLMNYLETGNKEAAAREILVDSNADDVPGFVKRRIDETKKFLGDDGFKELTSKLPMEDIAKVKSILLNKANENERERVLKENPWLEYRPESAPLLQRLKMKFNK